jgi:NAD(P)-dependent dehydrogenase (short-subunit alcohol dehydrogenase family)
MGLPKAEALVRRSWRVGSVDSEDERGERREVTPSGRLGRAEEITETFFSLLSDHAGYITGHLLRAIAASRCHKSGEP